MVYDVNGNAIALIYDINGNSTEAYDINGNLISRSWYDEISISTHRDESSNTTYYLIVIPQTRENGEKQYPFVRVPHDKYVADYGRTNALTISADEGWYLVINAYQNGSDVISMQDSNGNEIFSCILTKGATGIESSNKFTLFTYGGNVSATKYRFKGNFYYAKLTNANGDLVHYYIPCKDPNNVIGLYDIIAKSFLSPTVGTFTGKARG